MRWYKHFSKAHRDTKIKKLINEYGAEGYAVYFYCLELIADSIEHDNISFELEDDAELVGQYLKIDTLRVEKIMKKCIHLDLFGINGSGKITCLKMAKFLDERFTRNIELKKIIKSDKMESIKNQLSEDAGKTTGDNAPQLSRAKLRRAKKRKENKNVHEMPVESIELTQYFYDRLINIVKPASLSNKKPNMENWTDDMDKIIRIDGQSIETIKRVIDWTVRSEFWRGNVLSPGKLRYQFDKLEIQSRGKKSNKSDLDTPEKIAARSAELKKIMGSKS